MKRVHVRRPASRASQAPPSCFLSTSQIVLKTAGRQFDCGAPGYDAVVERRKALKLKLILLLAEAHAYSEGFLRCISFGEGMPSMCRSPHLIVSSRSDWPKWILR